MQVLFLTEGLEAPSSRFRAEQFFRYFERLGIRCTLHAGYGRLYNRLHTLPIGMAYRVACKLKRAAQTGRGMLADVVFLQRTALPYSALPEQWLSRVNPRLVFDYDDAIYLSPSGGADRWRRRAFDDTIRASAWVIAGNEHLALAGGAPSKTTVIPTVIDTARYTPPHRPSDGAVTVGWMGTSSNLPFVREVLPSVLAAVRAHPGARLRIVSSVKLPELEGAAGVEQIAWSADREIAHLQSFDIGLMPLPDDEITRGKCGFKMIQYMAVGAAVVASAVGANVGLFAGSHAGVLLPPDQRDWKEPLLELMRDPAKRLEAGEAGRRHAVGHLSVDSVIPAYVRIFERVASKRGRRRRFAAI